MTTPTPRKWHSQALQDYDARFPLVDRLVAPGPDTLWLLAQGNIASRELADMKKESGA